MTLCHWMICYLGNWGLTLHYAIPWHRCVNFHIQYIRAIDPASVPSFDPSNASLSIDQSIIFNMKSLILLTLLATSVFANVDNSLQAYRVEILHPRGFRMIVPYTPQYQRIYIHANVNQETTCKRLSFFSRNVIHLLHIEIFLFVL